MLGGDKLLTRQECVTAAGLALIDLYGKQYMREHFFTNSVHGKADLPNNIFQFFCAFESSESRPDLEPDDHGWTVSAIVQVDKITGKTQFVKYTLPDGTKMQDEQYPEQQ